MSAACSPFRPFTTIGLLLFISSTGLLLTALIRPYFFTSTILSIPTGGNPLTVTGNVGAFRFCLQTDSLSVCSDVDWNCELGSSDSLLPTFQLNDCGFFNTFRITLMGSIILLGLCSLFFYPVIILTQRTAKRGYQRSMLLMNLLLMSSLLLSLGSLFYFAHENDSQQSTFVLSSSFYLEMSSLIGIIVGSIGLQLGNMWESPIDLYTPLDEPQQPLQKAPSATSATEAETTASYAATRQQQAAGYQGYR